MRRLANKPPRPNSVPMTKVLGSGTGEERTTTRKPTIEPSDFVGLNSRTDES
jgi:hypothetical protein